MTKDKNLQNNKKFSLDWLVRGTLTRLGDMFDRLTGRHWQPSSSLATSRLIEKLKTLLDAEARDFGVRGKFVPHIIKLKMQWDKFSTDAEQSLKKVEYELLTAAIDHINDCRYYTYAPLQIEIKPDYFTEGVKLSAGFGEFAAEEKAEEATLNVTVPDLKNVVIPSAEEAAVEPEKILFIASFALDNEPKKVQLAFSAGQRKSVGRTRENDLWLDDPSVSKLHAALVLNGENRLALADTGSTNGTFVGGVRIAYGKAIVLEDADKLGFGTVEVELRRVETEDDAAAILNEDSAAENTVTNRNVSTENSIPSSDIYATRKDFQSNQETASERILPVKISPLTTVEDFSATKNDSAKDTTSVAEGEIARNSNDLKTGDLVKDEL